MMQARREATPRFGPRHAAVAILGAIAVLVMLLTSGQMKALRAVFWPLSRAMSWLDGLPLPLDMEHVAFFLLVAAALRVLLPRVQWWRLLLVLAVLAVGTELLQFGTIGRTPRLLDARDDMIGACIGLLLGTMPLISARRAAATLRFSTALLLGGIALLPFQKWSVAHVLDFPLLLSDVLFVLSLGMRVFALAGGNAPVRLYGFHGWLAAYVSAMLLAVLALPHATIGSGVAKWVGIVWLATIAALTCDAAADPGMRRRMLQAWLAGAVVAALVGWLAILGFYAGHASHALVAPLLSHYGSLPPGPYPRVVGVFANANLAGLFLLLSVAIGLAGHAAGWLSMPRLRGFLLLVSLPLLATASQAVGAVILLVAWWWFRRSAAARAKRFAVLGSGMALAGGILALLLVNPAAPFVEPSVRLQLWRQAWATWRGAFWRGSGLDQPPASLHYLAPDGGWQYLTDAHNIVLNLGAQGGVVAVIAFFGLVAWSWWRSRHEVSLAAMRTALLIAVGYLGLSGSFEDARVLWVFMGLVAGAAWLAHPGHKVGSSRPPLGAGHGSGETLRES